MYILDTMPDFVKILGYGLSGFAFLLMFFAYLLLRQVISKENASTMIFKSIWAFMGLSFLLTVSVGVFSYITGDYKQKQLAENRTTIERQQTGLELLKGDKQLDSLATTVVTGDAGGNHGRIDRIKREQEKILKEQESKLDKAEATAEEKNKFAGLKSESIKTLDSLQRSDIPPAKKQELRDKYLIQTKEISKISTGVVKRHTSSLAVKPLRQPQ